VRSAQLKAARKVASTTHHAVDVQHGHGACRLKERRRQTRAAGHGSDGRNAPGALDRCSEPVRHHAAVRVASDEDAAAVDERVRVEAQVDDAHQEADVVDVPLGRWAALARCCERYSSGERLEVQQ